VKQVASCAAYLPPDGAIGSAYSGSKIGWGIDTQLFIAMVNDLNWLVWAKTENAEKGINRPKPIKPPEENYTLSYEIDELKEILQRERHE